MAPAVKTLLQVWDEEPGSNWSLRASQFRGLIAPTLYIPTLVDVQNAKASVYS